MAKKKSFKAAVNKCRKKVKSGPAMAGCVKKEMGMPIKKCTYVKGYKHINIPIRKSGANNQKNIRDLETKLHKRGISFDTGMAIGKRGLFSRDWELDWSLEGAQPKTILKELKKAGIKHTIKKVCDSYN